MALATDVAVDVKYRGLSLVLIRPSKYDDDGYVMRHFRGVLPSNTLSCLYGLTREVAESGRFGANFDFRIHTVDETVMRIDPPQLTHKYRRRGYKQLFCLVGVQTNQFPRASDIARQLRALGAEVAIGGFHVSGAIAMSDEMPPECQALLDAGVTLVKGEVEDVWGDILEDVVRDRTRPFYDIVERPDLTDKPIPQVNPGYMKQFAFKQFGTIDAGRGCPYDCSFCAIVNVQGRKMRSRSADRIVEQIRRNYRGGEGINYYFFTDDNFARNPEWERIFDALIRLRQEEGVKITFMMQSDMKGTGVKNFARKAAMAGCSQVFLGIESINDDNLDAVGKKQNRADDYARVVRTWHEAGIAVHGTMIVGFPFDTYESVMADVRRLKEEVCADQVSFFMYTPLPGSRDHQNMVRSGRRMETDYNRFDSFHATIDHPRMSAEEWRRAFNDAWEAFYTPEHMKQALLRQNGHTYWGLFKNFIWFRNSIIEGHHPMIIGFWRLKDRKIRRAGFPIEGVWRHHWRRWGEIWRMLKEYRKLFFELQELWLQTRYAKEYATLRALKENLGNTVDDWQESLQSRIESLKDMGDAVRSNMQTLQRNLANLNLREMAGRRGGQLRDKIRRINILSVRRYATRRHLDDFWRRTRDQVKGGRWFRVNPFGVGLNTFRETKLAIHFLLQMKQEVLKST